ncbi:hypothetical protein COE80_22430 [Bacillus pseudomycoides]|uniref:hypothetical protein n=1 Tax=Bacillus pseudomycoides TaxID=64104 RepID=UPI000BF9A2B9|nr:hypothetical protein [Bacillus pseudomycoides]PGE94167.1 hypothetical protein COM62_25445 [Bacillus pseudomycoides]PHB21192.1 hypothetical protein COE80_22430 [Bacillus pseudomycoides]PHE30107.1 hypothetical protein COF51_27340 [Bacillus pseudomycoides]
MGSFTINRFNGIEKYEISEAKIYAVKKQENEIMLWLEVETEQEPIQSLPDTVDCKMNPSGEVTVYMDNLKLENFGEQEFIISKGYDEDSNDLAVRIYYFEHQEVNNNVLKMKYNGNGIFHINWTGITRDISYYDGSKPDITIEVNGEFIFEEFEEWL